MCEICVCVVLHKKAVKGVSLSLKAAATRGLLKTNTARGDF